MKLINIVILLYGILLPWLIQI